jgi:hypothetical protein
MSVNIAFYKAGVALVITKPPAYGYSTILSMAFKPVLSTFGTVTAWDNGIANDTRICKIPKMQRNASKQLEIETFFDSVRGELFQLSMGTVPTGFFPFGADLGDYGTTGHSDFDVYSLDQNSTGVLRAPWLHFENEIALVMKNKITYQQPLPVAQGSFLIGDEIELFHPQSEVDVSRVKSLKTELLHGGNCTSVDNGRVADYYTANVKLVANQPNTAAVIYYLQNTVRSKEFTITCPKNVYLFGRKNVKEDGTPNIYTVRLLSNEIEFTHVRLNRFEFTLRLIMVSRA